MVRLSPNNEYTATLKCLKSNETKDVKWPGFRLDYYMKHADFLVTVTSNLQPKGYAPIDRKAGTKFAEAKASEAQKSEITVTASNTCKGCGAEKEVDSTGHCDRC